MRVIKPGGGSELIAGSPIPKILDAPVPLDIANFLALIRVCGDDITAIEANLNKGFLRAAV